jgi:hypothetical protein
MTLDQLGTLKCADCGDTHTIMKDENGLLTSLERCKGRAPKQATRAQSTEIADNIRHVDSVVGDLKLSFDEGDWDQIRTLADEAIVKLNAINLTAGDIEKS